MKKLLIPTDFSHNAAKAMKFAMRLAHHNPNVHLIFFHATDTEISTRVPSRMYAELVENDLAMGLEKLKKEVHTHLQELGIKNTEINSEVLAVSGNFKDNIKYEVQKLGVEMIVMGTCGASGLKKFFFGSNTVDVMERVSCPVLAIPDNYKFHEVKTVAYAADFLTIEEGFEKVVGLAKLFNAPLTIFHIDTVLPHRLDHHSFDKANFIDNLAKKFGYEQINIEFREMGEEDSDDAMEGIQAYVAQKHPSILAMATYDRVWIEKLINPSLTKEMMFQTEIPMFAFKKTGEQED
jgi:nucleotide-binding universal stress UspA family protein